MAIIKWLCNACVNMLFGVLAIGLLSLAVTAIIFIFFAIQVLTEGTVFESTDPATLLWVTALLLFMIYFSGKSLREKSNTLVAYLRKRV